MTADIASLGISINTAPITAAKQALDQFTASATPAARAAAALEKSSGTSAKALGDFQKSGQLARHEMINLSRQLQDVGVSLVSGQSPFMVMAQQGTQIADIFSSSKTGSVGGGLKQIASYVTPMRGLALGITAVGAAGYYLNSSLKTDLLVLDDLSRAAGTTINSMRALQTLASSKGISFDEFAKGASSFASNVYQAKANMGGLADTFRVNNVHAKNFDDALEKAADLIKNAGSDQQRLSMLQAMGLPATMEWVRLMSGGSDAIRAAREEAVKFSDSAEYAMIAKARKFSEEWTSAWDKFRQQTQSAVLDAKSWFDGLGDSIVKLAMKVPGVGQNVSVNVLRNAYAANQGGTRLTATSDVSKFYDGLGAGTLGNSKKSLDYAGEQRALALATPKLGAFGRTFTAAELKRIEEKQKEESNDDRACDRRAA